jgi:hypothetical protein
MCNKPIHSVRGLAYIIIITKNVID